MVCPWNSHHLKDSGVGFFFSNLPRCIFAYIFIVDLYGKLAGKYYHFPSFLLPKNGCFFGRKPRKGVEQKATNLNHV